MKYNHFRPGKIISVGMFAGRTAELLKLEKCLAQAKRGNPNHFAIVGERGIGKSSLCLYTEVMAEGGFDSFYNGRFNFVVVSIALGDSATETDIVCQLGAELQHKLTEKFKIADLARSAWSFLSRWEVLGVAYHEGNAVEARPFELIDELAATIANASRSLVKEGGHGILFLIDEADKPSQEAHLGRTLKILTETLTRKRCDNVVFGLSGLPELFERLRQSHESAPRIFEPIELLLLQEKELIAAIDKGIREANGQNPIPTTVDVEAAVAIAGHSEGFPHFLQQFAYSAFEADEDNRICVNDVDRGTTAAGGAIDCLGVRYFRDVFWEGIGSDDYRLVLRAMAIDGKKWITKSTLRERTKIKEGILNNAINALKDRRVILPRPGKQGSYRLTSEAFAKWIRREKENV